jgi:hypothetical protein
MKLTYGKGNLQTQQGRLANGNRCLCITKHDKGHPINSVPSEWKIGSDESEIDVILEFENLESARTIQDELNELIAIWSKEDGSKLSGENSPPHFPMPKER